MDKAEELLNTLDVNDENLYPVSPYEEAHIVIGKDRVITVPPDLRRLGVQYDKNVESVTFDCPRYWDGIDLLNMAMYINYIHSDRKTGSYHVADTAVVPDDENMINFTWTISEHVAYVNGKITFLVCAKHSDSSGASTNRWNSEINRDCYISEGMDTNQVIEDVNTDLITQVLLKIDELDEKCTTIPTLVSQLENDSKYLEADGSVSFGRKTGTTVGEKSIAFGYDVEASGQYSFAEGELTKATGRGSHAEGGAGTIASGKYAHGEGYGTTASGQAAHSEGYNTYATGNYSHASGYNSKAAADMSNAENYATEANGKCSHAEGLISIANGMASHAEGGGTIASGKYQHVQGKYNVEDADNKYAHILGGGSDANNRKNIHTVDWDGNAEYAGDVIVHYGDNTIPIGAILKSLLDNPYMHRNIFRGKNFGESITAEQLSAIRDGSFRDLFVGDYWEKGGVKYRIADINYWKGVGYQESVQKPHILIVPDTILGSGQMNTSNSTAGGYRNSSMKNARLNQIANSLPDVFKNILISHRMFYDESWGNTSVDLMNEVMVHGTYICTDNNNRQTSDTQQLALFQLVPELKTIGANYWLRNLSSAQTYTLVSQYGDASNDVATSTYGIRPVFGIG